MKGAQGKIDFRRSSRRIERLSFARADAGVERVRGGEREDGERPTLTQVGKAC